MKRVPRSFTPEGTSPEPAGALRALTQSDVRAALRDGQLRVHYQVVVNLATGRPRGMEALLRWEHPEGGLLLPDDFLPAVAHTPVIHEVTRWVVRTALHDVRAWEGCSVSVNVTARDVTRNQLVRDIDDALNATGTDPQRLVLELPEQAVVEDLDNATKVLGALRERGVGVSLDDFGTGYSSLLYLRDLPLTELKIDRVFMSRVPESEEDVAIVRSVARLGRFLGLAVVAEGVETHEQMQAARNARCTAAQGFLWGGPQEAPNVDPTRVFPVLRLDDLGSPRPPSAAHLAAQRIRELLDEGASLHTIAAALNAAGLRTARQTRWTAPTVALVVQDLPDPHGGADG
jgi:EAL domain-containing protein (putative c-di-GMP-specific phosphodiesterase class I)